VADVSVIGFFRVSGLDDRQRDAKRGAAGWTVEAFDYSIVFLDDAVTNAESQACAFSRGLRGEERVEDMAGGFDTRAVVGELDDDI
jgi:hypothetical protein